MAEKVFFSISKELKEKLEKYKDRVNWDNEVQKFLERRIKELDSEIADELDLISHINSQILKSDERALRAYEAGKFVVACDGQYIGAFDSEKEAYNYVRGKGFKQCTIDHKSYKKQVGEWGWGSIALD